MMRVVRECLQRDTEGRKGPSPRRAGNSIPSKGNSMCEAHVAGASRERYRRGSGERKLGWGPSLGFHPGNLEDREMMCIFKSSVWLLGR